MKKVKLSFLLLSGILCSCSSSNGVIGKKIKKKDYMTGYSYSKVKTKSNSNNRFKPKEDVMVLNLEPIKLDESYLKNKTQLKEEPIASINKIDMVVETNKSPVLPTGEFMKNNNDNHHHNKVKSKKISKKKVKELLSNSDSGGSGLKSFGLVLMGIGLLIALFIHIIGGAVLLLIGLILLLIGSSIGSEPNEKESYEYTDVIYLKNGSIVKGIIVEETIGKEIKIETSGGSVFVYKMDEIEKIAKEKRREN